MKNTIVLFLLICSVLSNGVYASEKVSKKDIYEFSKDFKTVSGLSDKKFDKLVNKAYGDKHFVNGYISFAKKKVKVEVKGKKYKIPDWQNAIDEFLLSMNVNDDVLGSYKGLQIVQAFFEPLTPNGAFAKKVGNMEIFDRYYGPFANHLAKHGYCYGYLSALRYYLRYKGDWDKAWEVAKLGKKACSSNKKLPKWLVRGFFMEYEKINILRNGVEKSRNKGVSRNKNMEKS